MHPSPRDGDHKEPGSEAHDANKEWGMESDAALNEIFEPLDQALPEA